MHAADDKAQRLIHVAAVLRLAARRLLRADGVTFVVRDGNQCHYIDEEAVAPLWKGRRFPLSACVSGWVMDNAQSVVIPDVFADPRVLHEAYRATFVKSMAMVPVGDPPFAAIGAYWASTHDATANELEMLQAMADSADLAVHEALVTPR